MYVHPESRKKYCFANIEELESWAKELSFSSCILEQVEDIPKPLLCIKEWLSHNHTMVNTKEYTIAAHENAQRQLSCHGRR
jgi:hypothetical protein